MAYFEDKLLDLLPPIYRERDINGDLQAFLAIPAATLNEIKVLIDNLPDIWNVDACDPRFLPLLSEIVGYHFDPTRNPDTQRREILEIVEQYRRKGSIPAIRRALINVGWQGEIEETFRGALRLNKRSVIAHAKLPGEIYSLGVYRIVSRNITPVIRETLAPQHPAGMRVFFLQWLLSQESADDVVAALQRTVALHSTGRIHDVFSVGRRLLNSDFRLTKRQSTWSYWQITHQSTLSQGFESAGVVLNRWHGRAFGRKVNAYRLNADKIINVELSERRFEMICGVQTDPISTKPVVVRLARQHLNHARLSISGRDCRIVFRQKDYRAYANTTLEMAANLYIITRWPGQ